jgi:hypothetical protein
LIQTKQTSFTQTPMGALSQKLWQGTLIYQLLFLLITGIGFSRFFHLAFMGCLMGIIYLWSLLQSAQLPRQKGQSFSSLGRVAIFAYGVVYITQLKIPELTIVMLGLLSYKIILLLEYFAQGYKALTVFKGKK